MIECKNKLDFASFNLGDKVDAKVLHISEHMGRHWVELTRSDHHMMSKKGLDSEHLKNLILSQENLK